ncbi:Transaldolase / Glucose-6-phosphate isomerase [hydrothermal vent metagenome]|uniref:Transaldolase / Glucose-6-phosphate isomerase n=1 Tax=hydrothermal vent metagenome TaxID=652676 RepID=A0A3B0YPY2_9ZZZZ
MNPLQQLHNFGQSIWFDYIRRNLITSGELQRLVTEDGVMGVTSNPAIFEKAIAGSSDYRDAIIELSSNGDVDTKAIYESLAVSDIQQAADILRSVYDASERRDGYVSMEVSPRLAHDTEATLAEARRLWALVDRPNLMVKVPATSAGLPAIETLLSEGININVTLLFSAAVYEQVAETFIRGLEIRAANGGDITTVASVASFFISRIDSLVDNLIDECLADLDDAHQAASLESIKGKVAIANARVGYQAYQRLFSGDRWQALADKGATTQRMLWASTGVKNPAYRDTLYMEELIGPDTVNTVPPATMDAFREHGQPRSSLEEDREAAYSVLSILADAGISLEKATDQLLKDGLRLFVDAFDKVLGAVEVAGKSAGPGIGLQTPILPADLGKSVAAVLDDWHENKKVRRLWARDPWLWTGTDEARWLDWLDIAQDQTDHLGDLKKIFEATRGHYIKYIVLLGMGGSSLAPDVFRNTYGVIDEHPELLILDSTDPDQIRSIDEYIDYTRTKFLVSSKSGSTLEPNIFKEYFFTRAAEILGSDKAAANIFFAVTDPGSNLEKLARAEGFHRIFHGVAAIGGRYSALSNFGMVPGAGMGMDIERFLDLTMIMVEACAACVPARENPGVILGAILGAACSNGRDKITLIASPGISSLGAWLEQLLAESTGKEGKGLIPVDGEKLVGPEQYADDRVFAYLRLATAADAAQDAALERLAQAGQPVIRIDVPDSYHIGQEFFRWEIATAVASSVLGINPFNQPDVEASKVVTKELTTAYEETGSLPAETSIAQGGGITLYTDERNATELRARAGKEADPADYLKAHLEQLTTGDYFAILGYVNRMNLAYEASMQAIRHGVRDKFKVATCLGFGPRFLHSTGQAYKGGPNSGVFLQITCDDANDLQVPNHKYSFGVVKAAQARGDFAVLAERKRRALRVHLGKDTEAGFKQLETLIASALER